MLPQNLQFPWQISTTDLAAAATQSATPRLPHFQAKDESDEGEIEEESPVLMDISDHEDDGEVSEAHSSKITSATTLQTFADANSDPINNNNVVQNPPALIPYSIAVEDAWAVPVDENAPRQNYDNRAWDDDEKFKEKSHLKEARRSKTIRCIVILKI